MSPTDSTESPPVEAPVRDLGPLAWVLDELRKSLENANKALKRYVRDAEAARGTDLASVDSTQLRMARQSLHQAVGALDMVGQTAPGLVLKAMETLAQQFVKDPTRCSESAASLIERASFAVIDFLDCEMRGQSHSPVGLFPDYRDLLQLAGAERIHPADLWPQAMRWIDPRVPALLASPALDYSAEVRQRIERDLLHVMRGADTAAAADLRQAALSLAAQRRGSHSATFWKITAGFFDALAGQRVPVDLYVKRALSRVLLQYGALATGDDTVSERLSLDLLFYCAQVDPAKVNDEVGVLGLIRNAFGLTNERPVHYEERRFGRFDPSMLVQARKRIDTVKETWSALSSGDLTRLKNAPGQFGLVADSLTRLYPGSSRLAQALTNSVDATVRSNAAPGTELAMEIATVVLYLEAVFDTHDPDDPKLLERTQRLADRLEHVQAGGSARALEPWMEELYRRVSDQQTMGTVVGELRTALAEAEKSLDQFFRHPDERAALRDVPSQLAQMRGVLSVLGLDQASQAVARMRETVERIQVAPPGDTHTVNPKEFERLGNSLGAMGFLIDMLNYQPALARKLFSLDEETGELKLVMGRVSAGSDAGSTGASGPAVDLSREALSLMADPAAPVGEATARLDRIATHAALEDKPNLARSVSQAASAMASHDSKAVAGAIDRLSAAGATSAVEPAAPALAPVLEDDLRDIFLEEAREVVDTGRASIAELRRDPGNIEQQTTLRRAFHTLKGSSRMVGLTEFGEAAWSLEQMLNAWLSEQRPVSEDLMQVSSEALDAFGRWVGDIAAGADGGWQAGPFRQVADAQRLQQRYEPLAVALGAGVPTPAAPAALPSMSLAAAELPGLDQPAAPASAPALDVDLVDIDWSETQPPAIDTAASGGPGEPMVFDLPDLALESGEDIEVIEFTSTPESRSEPAEAMSEGDEPLPALDLDIDLGFEPASSPEASVSASDTPSITLEAEVPPLIEWTSEGELADASAERPSEALSSRQNQYADISVLDLDLEAIPPLAPSTVEPAAVEVAMRDPSPLPESAEAPPPVNAPGVEAVDLSTPEPSLAEPALEVRDEEEQVKVIGSLRVAIPLYNVYLNEADEWSRRLITELGEWALELHRPIPATAMAIAHSLAGSSATVGFTPLSVLARALEHALNRLEEQRTGTPEQAGVLTDAAEEVRYLLHQFAAGFLKQPNGELIDSLNALEPTAAPALRVVTPVAPAPVAATFDRVEPPAVQVPVPAASAPAGARSDAEGDFDDEDFEHVDDVDPDLFFIFEEEAVELLPRLDGALRQWVARPDNASARGEVLRALHTLKGSARLAGALRLGEMAHRMESSIEQFGSVDLPTTAELEPLQGTLDAIGAHFDRLRHLGQDLPMEPEGLAPIAQATPLVGSVLVQGLAPQGFDAPETAERMAPIEASASPAAEPVAPAEVGEVGQADTSAAPAGEVDAARVTPSPERRMVALPAAAALAPVRGASTQAVRVRAQLLDRLVNQAGEVMITRTRLESEMTQLKSSLGDMTSNLERLRQQLRDIELQAETQMQSRMAQAKDTQQNFDPLEFDRFTRVQELTRMMAESVNDVATVQRNLQRTLDDTEDELVSQARLTRELQRDLLRTRMVEFESISDRLYRVVRQAAKDTGKQVRLDIVGGAIEMDRGVLDRMTPAFEHLLRNCVAHGVEMPEARGTAGKEATGAIAITLRQSGNDVSVEFQDDGQGLDLAAIRARALEHGLVGPSEAVDEARAAELIFQPGFSTASEVSELAGRGIGMDVVRSEVQALGGRVETRSITGKGSSFNLVLPLTTAVTQIVMLRAGRLSIGVPAHLIELVRRIPQRELEQAYNSGMLDYGGQHLPFHWAGALLQASSRSVEPPARSIPVVIFQSAGQRIAVHVDEVLGNLEVVVKNLGPQLSRLPGLAGMSVLASGAVVLIYNPVALSSVYGVQARAFSADHAQPEMLAQAAAPQPEPEPAESRVPLVLVVDDSITVRRVTQRLLQREGYRVALAGDGLQALEQLQLEVPSIILSDIEMPRMDGFDLLRNIRNDARLASVPVVMITSRIAAKHREHAEELGAKHYLGKPYAEDDLLALVRQYTAAPVSA